MPMLPAGAAAPAEGETVSLAWSRAALHLMEDAA